MGHLQDALKHGRRLRAARKALHLRVLVRRGGFARILEDIDDFRPSDPASFRAHIGREMAAVRVALATPQITARRFHETRKVVSRLVAMFDCVDTLEPSASHRATVRYLSTINGLMGTRHDEMIARRLKGTQDYETETFALPAAIADRLWALDRAVAAG